MCEKIKLYILLPVLSIMMFLPTFAGNIVFKHLDMSDGLSHYSVTALYQDERGLMWMGTRNGISVYDGSTIEIFRHSPSDSTSIHNSYILDITGDQNGAIYILTNRGVSLYDVKEGAFSVIYKGVAADMIYMHDKLYISVGNRILEYNEQENKFDLYYELPDKSLNISSFFIDKGSLLLGTEGKGLYLYNRDEKELLHPIKNGRFIEVYKDTKERYWLGTLDCGLFLMKGESLVNYRHQYQEKTSICSDIVRKICEDKQGDIWIGTFGGLNKYIETTDRFERFQTNDNTKLSHSSVWSMYCDVQGTLWVGTYYGGVNFFNASETVCQHSIVDGQNGGELVVGTMVEDKNHNLWICTDGNGLCRMNLETNETKWFKHIPQKANSISHNHLKSIYYDEEKNVLWIGTHLGGLNRYDLETDRFVHYACTVDGETVNYKSNIVCDIIPYQDDLLLATHAGIYRFVPSEEKFIPMFKDGKAGDVIDLVMDLHIDQSGKLWIAGTDKGLYVYDFQKDKLKLYNSEPTHLNGLKSNGVICLYEDSKKRMWLCTGESGVVLYHEEEDGFEILDEEHHQLLSNCVYGACEIDHDKLMFITDNGFSCFNYENKQFLNYKANMNLPLMGINQKSIFRASNGRIYVGGVDGLISFLFEDLDVVDSPYNIFPSKLFVNDKEVEVGDETGILESSLFETPKITLKHGQNMFSIGYSVTNYIPLQREDIVYKLDNFSDLWSTLRNGRMVTYTNLNPGTYTLIVKNNADGENGPVSRLEIEILPPWYRTYIAYFCYLLALVGLLYLIICTYKNRVRLQTELEYERKHIKDVENLNQYKLRFFTNISHEFRTPLTIIIGQVELLLQIKSFVPSVYNRILNIYKNSLQLQSLITELLDFRKQEQGYMKIKVSSHNIVAFLQENYLLFKEYAQLKHINFSFEASEESLEVWYDSKQLQKVVNNLLSNAFQYTPEEGNVVLKVAKEADCVVVSVSDTGKGIKKNELVYIFDRFYQTDLTILSSSKGVGIGLALTKGIVELHGGTISVDSEEGKGSVFSFKLPLGNKHFRPDEILEEGMSDLINIADEKRHKDVYLMEEEEKCLPENVENMQSVRILIVEDDEVLRTVLADIFRPYYVVELATNGPEGLKKVNEIQPNIVLSDVLMPEMSGVELCKCIKSNVDTCHIPVVLLTARTAIEHKLEGLLYGADDYIVKPFDINILLARCRNLVNGRIVLQEKFSKQPQTSAQVLATNPLDKEFMDKAVAVVEKNLDNTEFNVTQFAQEMAIARTKLFVKLKMITGQTPNDFILTMRMKKAMNLLKSNPDLNISEISDRTGFSSPRYFSKAFKERYNQTPQAYRRGNSSSQVKEEENMAE